MASIAPSSGLLWLKQGWALFKQQPLLLSGLFATNILFFLLLASIPVVGPVLQVIVMPACNMAILSACMRITRGETVTFEVWTSTFRSKAFPVLCRLGMIYLAINLLALGLSYLVDNGAFLQLANGKVKFDPQSKTLPPIGYGWLPIVLCLIPAQMAIWFAGPLICWKNMPLFKAMFFSFFAICRALPAFLVLFFSAFGLAFAMLMFAALVSVITHSQGLGGMLLLGLLMMLFTVLYCAVYPAYVQIFGAQDAPGSAL